MTSSDGVRSEQVQPISERVQLAVGEDRGGSSDQGARVVEMQRRRLLLAFTEVLAEDGLENARAGRVCKRARVSRRTFYELFEDREACFLAALEETLARISERLALVVEQAGSWRERVRRALSVLLELFDEQPALARVCLIETLKAGPEVLECRRCVLEELANVVEEGRGDARRGGGPPPLTAESVVGGVIAVIHARLLGKDDRPLIELVNPLMSMIVLPYLGPVVARRELERPVPQLEPLRNGHSPKPVSDPFKDLSIRITFRTARVLTTIASQPGASNRQIGDAAGVPDQGQISKLLARLQRSGLLQNSGQGHPKGEANAWTLTDRGHAIQHAIGAQTPD